MWQHVQVSGLSGERVLVYHGTDITSAADIMTVGISPEKAMVYNGMGDFWVTKNLEIASWFAAVNPAEGEPAILKIELASGCIVDLMSRNPPLVVEDTSTEAYQFCPESVEILNSSVTSIKLIEINIT